MTRPPRVKAVTPEAALWRTDVEWPQDREPLMALLSDRDLPVMAERLRKLGLTVSGTTKAAVETALKDESLPARVANPAKGAGTLALALVAQHPAGMDRDHLQFELTMLLEDDRRTADVALASLDEMAVVIQVNGRRGERYRVIPSLRPLLSSLTLPWLDALERKGAAAGVGDVFGLRVKTSPGHILALLLAYLGAQPPRLRSATAGTELHSKDQARVLEALHHVMDRTLIPQVVNLAVRAGLARPNGTRLTLSQDAPSTLSAPPQTFWKRLMVTAVNPRAFAALLRMVREVEPGFVPESTLRRAIKTLHHTEQLVGGHPFPTDARGNEASARAELDMLRASVLFEQGRTPEGAPALRLHPAIHRALHGVEDHANPGKADGHVGADHELHVGPAAPPHLLASLGFFAVPQALDTVSRFHITPQSVAGGAARGILPEQMEEVLKELAARGLPDNVLRTLQDYGAQRGRAAFGRGLILAFASEADARKAHEDGEMSTMLGEPLTPTVFLVDTARETRARARLMELGLAVAEDTLMYSPVMHLAGDEDPEGDEAAHNPRATAARQQTLIAALSEIGTGATPPIKPPAAQLLHALTGNPALGRSSAPGGGTPQVIPLRAKKTAPTGNEGTLGALEKALTEKRTVRLQYTPEAGGGVETMTVEVVEVFERSGVPMLRVRFPRNPKAAERVLRVSRVAWVENAPPQEGSG